MTDSQGYDFDSLAAIAVDKRWRGQKYPQPSVLALISRNVAGEDEFLLIKRIKEPYMGKWSLVGGKWDFGESLQHAVTREALEETGLKTTFVGLKALINERVAPSRDEATAGHFLLFVCLLRCEGGHASEQYEGAVGWFSRPALQQLKAQRQIIPTDFTVIEYALTMTDNVPFVEANFRAAGNDGEADIFHFNVVADGRSDGSR